MFSNVYICQEEKFQVAKQKLQIVIELLQKFLSSNVDTWIKRDVRTGEREIEIHTNAHSLNETTKIIYLELNQSEM